MQSRHRHGFRLPGKSDFPEEHLLLHHRTHPAEFAFFSRRSQVDEHMQFCLVAIQRAGEFAVKQGLCSLEATLDFQKQIATVRQSPEEHMLQCAEAGSCQAVGHCKSPLQRPI